MINYETDAAGGPDSDTPESELTKAARSTWARLIKKVYEVQVLADVLKVRDSGILRERVQRADSLRPLAA